MQPFLGPVAVACPRIIAAECRSCSAYQWSTSTWKLASTFTDSSSKGMIASDFSPGGGNGHVYLWSIHS
ncbi:MAG: hypothetical protein ACRDPY_15870 [Streptosporangiaceae bacterium]